MSVKIRPYRTGGWEVDITVRLPNGSRLRERSKASVSSKSAAQRWGEDRERHLLQHGPPQPPKEVPTRETFAPRFVDAYARANRQKPSGIVGKESILALEWGDVDLGKRQLCIQRSDWRGHVTAPKSGRLRHVPMTVRLAAALREHRHLRAARVICQRDGSPLTEDMVADHVGRAAKRAGLATSGVRRLRHSFCSHLAMRGAPARAIQELAGHQDLITTQRYMHLSPAAIEGAIRLLDQRGPSEAGHYVRSESRRSESGRGEILETADLESAISNP